VGSRLSRTATRVAARPIRPTASCASVLWSCRKGPTRSCHDTHFAEMLLEREQISISRETLRSIRREEKIAPKRKRRARVHHKRRPRKEAEGLMMLWDGSAHRWFGREHDPCCLMAALDDATGKALGLLFTEHECSAGYLGASRARGKAPRRLWQCLSGQTLLAQAKR